MDKFCECGCGWPLPSRQGPKRADNTYPALPPKARFLRGHNLRVTHPSWWKGDDAGYRALHTYVNKHYPKNKVCEECKQDGRTDYALIHGREYSRDRTDYRELCRVCHTTYDRQRDHGESPLCKCGCGRQVTWYQARGRWHLYVSGHYDLAAENRRRVKDNL